MHPFLPSRRLLDGISSDCLRYGPTHAIREQTIVGGATSLALNMFHDQVTLVNGYGREPNNFTCGGADSKWKRYC